MPTQTLNGQQQQPEETKEIPETPKEELVGTNLWKLYQEQQKRNTY